MLLEKRLCFFLAAKAASTVARHHLGTSQAVTTKEGPLPSPPQRWTATFTLPSRHLHISFPCGKLFVLSFRLLLEMLLLWRRRGTKFLPQSYTEFPRSST